MDAQMAASNNPMAALLENMTEEQMAQIMALFTQFVQSNGNKTTRNTSNNDDDEVGNVPNLN